MLIMFLLLMGLCRIRIERHKVGIVFGLRVSLTRLIRFRPYNNSINLIR